MERQYQARVNQIVSESIKESRRKDAAWKAVGGIAAGVFAVAFFAAGVGWGASQSHLLKTGGLDHASDHISIHRSALGCHGVEQADQPAEFVGG